MRMAARKNPGVSLLRRDQMLRERMQTPALRQVFPDVGHVRIELVFDDPNHRREQDRIVNGEARWQTIGLVNELLLVCHTWTEEDVVRIVSARKANRTERNRYDHGHRPL